MIRILARLRSWRRSRRFEAFAARQLRRELSIELTRLQRINRSRETAL